MKDEITNLRLIALTEELGAVQRGLRLLKAIEFTDAMLTEAAIAREMEASATKR